MKKDYEDTTKSEDFEYSVVRKIGGVRVLLNALEFSDEAGSMKYQKEAYEILGSTLNETLIECEKTQKLISELDKKVDELENIKKVCVNI